MVVRQGYHVNLFCSPLYSQGGNSCCFDCSGSCLLLCLGVALGVCLYVCVANLGHDFDETLCVQIGVVMS
jgi:hypothetical protein